MKSQWGQLRVLNRTVYDKILRTTENKKKKFNSEFSIQLDSKFIIQNLDSRLISKFKIQI